MIPNKLCPVFQGKLSEPAMPSLAKGKIYHHTLGGCGRLFVLQAFRPIIKVSFLNGLTLGNICDIL
jgi:hypothetical protein